MRNPTWRLIRCEARDGAWNMATDEAILEAVGRREMRPTLRLYRWDPPCLSLGYAQPIVDVDQTALAALGWHLVRRPTGGRAILHTDELTYSVIAPLDEPLVTGSILESYRRLSQALLNALRRLGLLVQADDEYPQAGLAPANAPVCFERPSNYEITAGGKKLIGSAQARRREGVLQHGSLPLHGDLTRITRVLRYENEDARRLAAQRLLERATTVETVLAHPVAWETAADVFALAFQQTLSIQFKPAQLSQTELERANQLIAEKYAHPTWTDRI